MSSTANKLKNIVQNTHRVMEQYRFLKVENDHLKLENQSLTTALDASIAKTQQLEEKLKALTVARTLEAQEPTRALSDEAINEKILDTKRKINDFVREIDRCIELLR
jgi:regulator of replication initiation timing